MSRFSKKEAQTRGWAFVHETDEEHIITSDTQGERRIVPASLRAEKTINGVNVSVEAETSGKLLERIAAIESHQDALPKSEVDLSKQSEGFEAKGDTEPVETKQVIVDTSHLIDAPGVGAGGVLVIPADVDSPEEHRIRLDEAAHAAEVARVVGANDSRNDTEKLVDNPAIFAHGGVEVEPLTEQQRRDEHEAQVKAIREERDSAPPEEARSDKGAAKQSAAAQKAAADEHEDVNATPAAVETAERLDVDLGEVEGTGADGKITKPDVEAVAAEADDGSEDDGS